MIYIQILVKIFVSFLRRCLKPLLPKFQSFSWRLSDVGFCYRRTLEHSNTRTDLRIGLFPSGISSKRFFTGVDFVGVDLLILPCIDSWTNEYSDPKFRILRAQRLQTRLEYSSHFTTSIPTFWQTCAKTSPLQSFLLDGLKRFSVEIWLDFKLPNF